MHAVKNEVLVIMKSQGLHNRLGIVKDFETWLIEILQDVRFAEGHDYWFFDPENPDGPATTDSVYFGIGLCKELAQEQQTDQGRESFEYFSQFPESTGCKRITGIRGEAVI